MATVRIAIRFRDSSLNDVSRCAHRGTCRSRDTRAAPSRATSLSCWAAPISLWRPSHSARASLRAPASAVRLHRVTLLAGPRVVSLRLTFGNQGGLTPRARHATSSSLSDSSGSSAVTLIYSLPSCKVRLRVSALWAPTIVSEQQQSVQSSRVWWRARRALLSPPRAFRRRTSCARPRHSQVPYSGGASGGRRAR